MKMIGAVLTTLGVIGTAVLLPMIYLAARGNPDPEGIVDGLIRVSWTMPILWVGGLVLEHKGGGHPQTRAPLAIVLAIAAFYFLGVRNFGREIVLDASPDDRIQAILKSRGEEAYLQGSIPMVGPLGHWGHRSLPAHPIPMPRGATQVEQKRRGQR